MFQDLPSQNGNPSYLTVKETLIDLRLQLLLRTQHKHLVRAVLEKLEEKKQKAAVLQQNTVKPEKSKPQDIDLS